MHIAISGSSGFIGSALARELRSQGHEIHPIVRRLPRSGEIGLDLTNRRLDLSNLETQSLDEIDLIYHLAGEPLTTRRWNAKRREMIRSSRITSTDIISRAIALSDNPPRALVTGSAIGYYGNRGDEQLTEVSTSGHGFLAELCRAWEAATGPAKAVGVRVVHARSGVVLGHGGGIVKSLTPLFQLGLGAKLGSGEQWMSYIALSDEVKALHFVGTHENIVGPCNLVSPNPVTNAAFTKAFGKFLHRPAVLSVPSSVLRIALGRYAANDMALTSQRVTPQRLLEEGFDFDYPNIAEALRAD